MTYETILYERKDKIVYITLNRPRILNAVNDRMMHELVDAVHQFDADEEAWVAILSGAGRCFSSGADVKQRQLRPREEMWGLGGPRGAVRAPGGGMGLGETVNWKPVIAAVHSYVIGAAFGLAMDVNWIIAAEGTQFQIREAQRGLGGAQHWATGLFPGEGRGSLQRWR